MTVQPGLCRTWSETQIVGFLMHRLKSYSVVDDKKSVVDDKKSVVVKLNPALSEQIFTLYTEY